MDKLLVLILALEEPEKSIRLQSLCTDLFIDISTSQLNILHLQSSIVPLFHSKISTLEQEISSLEEKKSKNETIVNNLKKLAGELESQMESFLYKSKTTQLTMHQQRENLTVDFSKGVDSISTRLKELEAKKLIVNDEYKALQSEFSLCIHDFETQEKEVGEVQSELANQIQDNDNDNDNDGGGQRIKQQDSSGSTLVPKNEYELYDDLNFEEENAMMFEDYRSHLYVLDQQDINMKADLAIAVSKFQELSTGLLTSKNCLIEHHMRIAELEKTLVSLEGQQKKGKQILKEINRVIEQEKINCESSKAAVESTKIKLNRCLNMTQAFDTDIISLQNEIAELQRLATVSSSDSGGNSNDEQIVPVVE